MITEVKTEVVPLTLEIAKHYRRMASLNGDRDVDSPKGRLRVNKLRQLNVAGDFYSPVWSAVQVTSEKGKKYRVDGAHSTQMLVEAGSDFPDGLSVTIRHFRCADMGEAVNLWEQFNPAMSTRTASDLALNRAAYTKGLENLKATTLTVPSRGIAKHFVIQDPKNARYFLDYIFLYPEFIIFASEFVHLPMFKKTGVMAAMFSVWGKDQQQAGLFWRRVRDGSSVDPKCPTRTLQTYLLAMVVQSKAGGVSDRPFKQYTRCHHAWNAWRKGKTTKLNFVEGCPIPKPI